MVAGEVQREIQLGVPAAAVGHGPRQLLQLQRGTLDRLVLHLLVLLLLLPPLLPPLLLVVVAVVHLLLRVLFQRLRPLVVVVLAAAGLQAAAI